MTRQVYNKIGIAELQIQRYKEARKDFEKAIKTTRILPTPTTISAPIFYEQKKIWPAIKQYQKALKLDETSARITATWAQRYFAKKDFEKAA